MARKKKTIELEDSGSDRPDTWFGSLNAGPKIVVLFSMVVMVVGLTLQAFAFLSTPADGPAVADANVAERADAGDPTNEAGEGGLSLDDAGVSGFVEQNDDTTERRRDGSSEPDSESGETDPAAADEEEDSSGIDSEMLREWSPVIFKLGFSFFVGFAIGAAVRSFLKLAFVLIGGMLLLLFGLQYGGIIDVDWAAMEVHYDRIVAWLESETTDFRAFIQGALPSSAMGATGLILGFRKR